MDLSQRSDLTQGVHRSSGSFELVIGAVILALIGLFVDRAVGTTPLFVIIGACAGFVGATVSIYYRYKAAMVETSVATTWAGRTAPADGERVA